jgi:hypothetical protein
MGAKPACASTRRRHGPLSGRANGYPAKRSGGRAGDADFARCVPVTDARNSQKNRSSERSLLENNVPRAIFPGIFALPFDAAGERTAERI